jgi:uncharacterized protein (TIGR03437 family)
MNSFLKGRTEFRLFPVVVTLLAVLGCTDSAVAQTTNGTISATPAGLNFCVAANTSAAPAAQTLTITNTGGAPTPIAIMFSGASCSGLPAGNSCSFNPPSVGPFDLSLTTATVSSTNPASVTVSANPAGLATGTYSADILVSPTTGASTANTINVPVTLTVGTGSLYTSQSNLTFAGMIGGLIGPSDESAVVGYCLGASALPTNTILVATTSSIPSGSPNPFTVNPTATITATTPATFQVSLSQTVLATLTPGTYTGTVTVSASGTTNLGAVTLPVDLVVGGAGLPLWDYVANSASGAPNAIYFTPGVPSSPQGVSPGELVSFYGLSLGPTPGLTFTLNSAGMVPTTLGKTQVMFDTFAAPLLYVSANQINAIVPYEIAGRTQTNVVVSSNGLSSIPLTVGVAATDLAIFTQNASGDGLASILNQDYSVNGASNPAAIGSFVSIYGTGEGTTNSPQATGSVTPPTDISSLPVTPISLTIGGQTAQILYAGEAPGLVAGVVQMVAYIPVGLPSGPAAVQLSAPAGGPGPAPVTAGHEGFGVSATYVWVK